MQAVLDANVDKLADADKILQNVEDVSSDMDTPGARISYEPDEAL